MREYITDELVETTYLFCVKRISETGDGKASGVEGFHYRDRFLWEYL